MFVSDNLSVNKNGNLAFAGVDAVELAKKYSTPLYLMDEDMIRDFCRQYKASFDRYYDGKGRACYASKAFCCKEICRIMGDEGMGLDVVSLGELYTAMSVDFPADGICFHGNNKTAEELKLALEYNVGHIIVDNLQELNELNALAVGLGKKASVMFRIKPGIDAHTHDFIRTGQIDSKFGVALETGEAFDIIKTASQMNGIEVTGVHCHIGSQIFDIDPFVEAADVMMRFIKKLKDELSLEIRDLNLGGGFGIKYVESDDPVPYDRYMEKVSERVNALCKEFDINRPFIMIEPGRSIVAPAGITLYTVGAVKEIPGIRTYVSVDGGMCDNPRYALYQSKYEVIVANKASEERNSIVTVAGKCCESGDLIGEGMKLQNAEAGDIIAVCATGAYNYSMSSNYNRNLTPAVVMVKDKKDRVIVKRQTVEDIVRNDI